MESDSSSENEDSNPGKPRKATLFGDSDTSDTDIDPDIETQPIEVKKQRIESDSESESENETEKQEETPEVKKPQNFIDDSDSDEG